MRDDAIRRFGSTARMVARNYRAGRTTLDDAVQKLRANLEDIEEAGAQ